MISGVHSGLKGGEVSVTTTQNGGLSVEYWAEKATDKIIYISNDASPLIKEQAQAFKNQIYTVVLGCMKNAIVSNNTTVVSQLLQQGQPDLAEILRRL